MAMMLGMVEAIHDHHLVGMLMLMLRMMSIISGTRNRQSRYSGRGYRRSSMSIVVVRIIVIITDMVFISAVIVAGCCCGDCWSSSSSYTSSSSSSYTTSSCWRRGMYHVGRRLTGEWYIVTVTMIIVIVTVTMTMVQIVDIHLTHAHMALTIAKTTIVVRMTTVVHGRSSRGIKRRGLRGGISVNGRRTCISGVHRARMHLRNVLPVDGGVVGGRMCSHGIGIYGCEECGG